MGSKAYNAYSYETDSALASYCSLGSKNYSYVTESGEAVTKARGFTLSSRQARETLNPAVMRRLLEAKLAADKEAVRVDTFAMKVCRKTLTIKNDSVKKLYRNDVYDKRFVVPAELWPSEATASRETPNVCTAPFGVKHLNFADWET